MLKTKTMGNGKGRIKLAVPDSLLQSVHDCVAEMDTCKRALAVQGEAYVSFEVLFVRRPSPNGQVATIKAWEPFRSRPAPKQMLSYTRKMVFHVLNGPLQLSSQPITPTFEAFQPTKSKQPLPSVDI